MPRERLQKILAHAGVASRRNAEQLIVAGRVRVNGRVVTELGSRADPRKDKVELDGERVHREDKVYLVVHKPRGYVSTVDDPEGRPTAVDLVEGVSQRLYPVGRLDFATSGVLLLTNDGDFTQALLHPKRKVPKVYVVKLDGVISDEEIARWREGIELDDGKTAPAEVTRLRDEQGKTWLRLVLREGRNQQIRRMAAESGFTAMRLARVSFADIDHEGLRPGQWRPLTADELRQLKKSYGVPRRVRGQHDLFRLWNKQQQAKEDRKKKRSPPRRRSRARRSDGRPGADQGRAQGGRGGKAGKASNAGGQRRRRGRGKA